jgi:hypothetical protein
MDSDEVMSHCGNGTSVNLHVNVMFSQCTFKGTVNSHHLRIHSVMKT